MNEEMRLRGIVFPGFKNCKRFHPYFLPLFISVLPPRNGPAGSPKLTCKST